MWIKEEIDRMIHTIRISFHRFVFQVNNVKKWCKRMYHGVMVEVYKRPYLYKWIIPKEIPLDEFTRRIRNLRVLFEKKKMEGADPALVVVWEQKLNQFEWEQVRELERSGRGDDPFVLWKKGRA